MVTKTGVPGVEFQLGKTATGEDNYLEWKLTVTGPVRGWWAVVAPPRSTKCRPLRPAGHAEVMATECRVSVLPCHCPCTRLHVWVAVAVPSAAGAGCSVPPGLATLPLWSGPGVRCCRGWRVGVAVGGVFLL